VSSSRKTKNGGVYVLAVPQRKNGGASNFPSEAPPFLFSPKPLYLFNVFQTTRFLILSAFRGASNFRDFNLFRRFFHRRLAFHFVAIQANAKRENAERRRPRSERDKRRAKQTRVKIHEP
jgi:hypothetical protein